MNTALLGLAVTVCVSAPPATAQRPADQLLRMVPADVGGVLVLQDADALWDRLMNGPVWAKIQQLPDYRKWRQSPGYAKFQEKKGKIEAVFGDIETVLKNLAGRCAVLAFTPPGPGQAKGTGVLLTWIEDVDAFAATVAKLEQTQQKDGSLLGVTEKSVDGVAYRAKRVREKKKKVEKTQYWAQVGHVFVLTDNEPLMRRVLGLTAKRGAGSLGSDGTFKAAMSRLPASATAKAYVNPRRFDAQIQGQLAKASASAEPGKVVFARVLQKCWPAIPSIGAALEFADGVVVRIHVGTEDAKLPGPIRAWRATAAKQPALWRALPANPMATFIGRLDVPAVIALLEENGVPKTRQGLRALRRFLQALCQTKDVDKEVLAKIGPDFAVVLTCPAKPNGAMGVPRLTAVLAMGGAAGQPNRLMTDLGSSLDLLMRVVLLDPKNKAAEPLIQQQRVGDVVVRHLPKVAHWPEGVMPGYAVCGQYMVIGTNKDEVAAMVGRLTGSGAPGGKLAAVRKAKFAGAQSVLYIDLKQCQAVLRTHRQWLLKKEVAKGKKTAERIKRDQDNLIRLLDLVDSLYWAKTIRPNSTEHTIGVVGAPE